MSAGESATAGDAGDDAGADQARLLRAAAAEGGLRFEAYLPPKLAAWLLDLIAGGTFASPSEAVFAILQEQRELEPHIDLRREALRRRLDVAINEPRPSVSAESVFARLEEKLRSMPEPAVWQGKA